MNKEEININVGGSGFGIPLITALYLIGYAHFGWWGFSWEIGFVAVLIDWMV